MKNIILNIKDTIEVFYKKNKTNILLAIGVLAFIIVIYSIVAVAIKDEQNISGNLRNMGFSAIRGNDLYYLGFNNGEIEGIYKTNKSNNKKTKIITDEYGLYLNIEGKYIYYLEPNSKSIIKNNGKNKEVVIQNIDLRQFTVKDGWIYYFENSNFYKIKTNGKNKTKLSDKDITNYQIKDNLIYYSYKEDGKHIIARIKTNGKKETIIDSDSAAQFFLIGDKIYYIKENYNYDNYEYEYNLCSIKTNGKNKKDITKIEGQINTDTINSNKDYLYYAKEDKDKKMSLYKIKLNGKGETKILDLQSYSTLINIYDSFIYYTDIIDGSNTKLFRIKLNGKDKQEIKTEV